MFKTREEMAEIMEKANRLRRGGMSKKAALKRAWGNPGAAFHKERSDRFEELSYLNALSKNLRDKYRYASATEFINSVASKKLGMPNPTHRKHYRRNPVGTTSLLLIVGVIGVLWWLNKRS